MPGDPPFIPPGFLIQQNPENGYSHVMDKLAGSAGSDFVANQLNDIAHLTGEARANAEKTVFGAIADSIQRQQQPIYYNPEGTTHAQAMPNEKPKLNLQDTVKFYDYMAEQKKKTEQFAARRAERHATLHSNQSTSQKSSHTYTPGKYIDVEESRPRLSDAKLRSIRYDHRIDQEYPIIDKLRILSGAAIVFTTIPGIVSLQQDTVPGNLPPEIGYFFLANVAFFAGMTLIRKVIKSDMMREGSED